MVFDLAAYANELRRKKLEAEAAARAPAPSPYVQGPIPGVIADPSTPPPLPPPPESPAAYVNNMLSNPYVEGPIPGVIEDPSLTPINPNIPKTSPYVQGPIPGVIADPSTPPPIPFGGTTTTQPLAVDPGPGSRPIGTVDNPPPETPPAPGPVTNVPTAPSYMWPTFSPQQPSMVAATPAYQPTQTVSPTQQPIMPRQQIQTPMAASQQPPTTYFNQPQTTRGQPLSYTQAQPATADRGQPLSYSPEGGGGGPTTGFLPAGGPTEPTTGFLPAGGPREPTTGFLPAGSSSGPVAGSLQRATPTTESQLQSTSAAATGVDPATGVDQRIIDAWFPEKAGTADRGSQLASLGQDLFTASGIMGPGAQPAQPRMVQAGEQMGPPTMIEAPDGTMIPGPPATISQAEADAINRNAQTDYNRRMQLYNQVQQTDIRSMAMGNIEAARTREAPQLGISPAMAAAQIERGQETQARGGQMGALGMIGERAAGTAPSAAEMQLRMGQERLQKQAMSLMRSNPGLSPGQAARMAAEQQSQIGLQTNQQAGMLRAQEQTQAQRDLMSGYGAMRGADIGLAAQQAGFGQEAMARNLAMQGQYGIENLRSVQGQQQMNDQLVSQYLAMGLSVDQARLKAATDMQSLANELMLGQIRGSTAERAQNIGLLGAGIGAVGSLIGGLIPFSDKRLKKGINTNVKSKVAKMLEKIEPSMWEYKKKEYGQGKHLGVMAQDLEKSKLGKLLVDKTNDGLRYIDAKKALSASLASMAVLHNRIKKLETKGVKNG
jgi:hypothetical protein